MSSSVVCLQVESIKLGHGGDTILAEFLGLVHLSPADVSNYSIKMYRLTARAVPAAGATGSKKNRRHRHAD